MEGILIYFHKVHANIDPEIFNSGVSIMLYDVLVAQDQQVIILDDGGAILTL